MSSGVERFQLRDAFSAPGLLSLVRAPLAAAFPFVLHNPVAALALLAAAAASDLLDGWWARRSGRATVTGAVLDPVMDKLFVATVAVTLLVSGRLSLLAVLLLGVRDIVELPLVLWMAFDAGALADRSGRVKANAFGKGVTVLQFVTIAAAIVGEWHVTALALASAASGTMAGATYWARALGRRRTPRPRKAA